MESTKPQWTYELLVLIDCKILPDVFKEIVYAVEL